MLHFHGVSLFSGSTSRYVNGIITFDLCNFIELMNCSAASTRLMRLRPV